MSTKSTTANEKLLAKALLIASSILPPKEAIDERIDEVEKILCSEQVKSALAQRSDKKVRIIIEIQDNVPRAYTAAPHPRLIHPELSTKEMAGVIRKLIDEGYTYRQICCKLGFKSPSSIHEILRKS